MVEATIEAEVEEKSEEVNPKSNWEKTIEKINRLNDKLLTALEKRSKFPIARDYFDYTLRRHEKGNPQRELESKGLDTIGWHSIYSKIVEKICQEGDFVEGVIEAQLELENIVKERINIGKEVIAHKAPRGINITRKEREKEIYNSVRHHAYANNMDPDAIEAAFRIIIEQNKYVQSLYSKHHEKFEEVTSCRTMVTTKEHERLQKGNYARGFSSSIDSIRSWMETQGKILAEKTGETYYVVVEPDPKKGDALPAYKVKLVKE